MISFGKQGLCPASTGIKDAVSFLALAAERVTDVQRTHTMAVVVAATSNGPASRKLRGLGAAYFHDAVLGSLLVDQGYTRRYVQQDARRLGLDGPPQQNPSRY